MREKNRKKWIMVQIISVILISVLFISMLIAYREAGKAYYIEYAESSDVSYSVSLKPNDFYDKNVLDGGQGYVASLIDKIDVNFAYGLAMSADAPEYEYTYSVIAVLNVIDGDTKAVIFDHNTITSLSAT